jgi:hypothetical protein
VVPKNLNSGLAQTFPRSAARCTSASKTGLPECSPFESAAPTLQWIVHDSGPPAENGSTVASLRTDALDLSVFCRATNIVRYMPGFDPYRGFMSGSFGAANTIAFRSIYRNSITNAIPTVMKRIRGGARSQRAQASHDHCPAFFPICVLQYCVRCLSTGIPNNRAKFVRDPAKSGPCLRLTKAAISETFGGACGYVTGELWIGSLSCARYGIMCHGSQS